MNEKTKKNIPLKKRLAFIFFNLILMVAVLFVGGEIYVRLKGYKPFSTSRPDVVVEPGGKYFQKDKDLGYTHLPGKFKITIANQHTFVTTHGEDTLRITHPLEQNDRYASKEKVWILGCSITHGWCLNDNETFPWLVQQEFPDYDVVNFGVSGYGNVHSLIQLQNALKTRKKPKLVILTYATFHDTRNTFSLVRRRTVSAWNFLGPLTQPYATMDKEGNLVLHHADKVVYSPWPLAKVSALVNYLESKYIAREAVNIPHHKIAKLIIRRISEICAKEGIPLIVAGIKDNPHKRLYKIFQYCDKHKIPNVDIAVDLDKKENNFLPIDGHPSALANRKYADKLCRFLKEGGFLKPKPAEEETPPPAN